jgi:O-antigen/teichoic acid export membrane protein
VFIPFSLILFFLLPFSSLPKELIPVLVAQIFVDTTVTFFLSKYRYRYRYKVYVSINIIISALTYIISLILITLFDLREMGRMYGMLFAALPFAALFFVNIISSFKNLYDKRIWRYILLMSLPNTVHHISLALLSGADKLIIEMYLGKTELSKYSIAYSLGLVLSFVTNTVNTVFAPWVLRKIRAGQCQRVREVNGKIFYCLSLLTLSFMALAKELLSLLAPSGYANAVYLIYPIALSVLPMFLTTTLVISETFYQKRMISLVASPLTAFLNIVLNFVFIRSFGLLFAAIITPTCYLILFLLHTLLIKLCKLPLVVSVRSSVVYIALFSLLAVLIAFLTVSLLSRILIILALILMLLPSIGPIKRMLLEPT